MNPVFFHTHVFQQIGHHGKLTACIVITFQVMAFAGMSAGHPHTVGPFPEGGQDKFGTHASGAGNADDSYVFRVLHAAYPGKIRCAVTAPVTQEAYNFGCFLF